MVVLGYAIYVGVAIREEDQRRVCAQMADLHHKRHVQQQLQCHRNMAMLRRKGCSLQAQQLSPVLRWKLSHQLKHLAVTYVWLALP